MLTFLFVKANSLLYYLIKYPFYKLLLGKMGRNTRICSPLKIEGFKNIKLGSNCVIGYKSWLACLPLTNQECKLIIKDGCRIGNFNHIYATNCISIESHVMTADKVYIADNTHSYTNIYAPVLQQPILQLEPVTIGEGSWIGQHACIMGVSIGKHCVIGANSVVTSNIPDYSVAVGAPARVIKRYCFRRNEWRKTDSKGNII